MARLEPDVPLSTDRRVGTEYTRDERLALLYRPAMIEKRAEIASFDPAVGAKQVLAEEIEEYPSYRRLGEGNSALVTGRRPGVLVGLAVTQQGVGKRRQEL